MPTNSATGTAKGRENVPQVVNTIRKRVTWNEAGNVTGIPIEWIRQGSIILESYVIITTGFNAGTTNVLSAGTNGPAYDNVITSAQSVSQTPGQKLNLVPTGTALGPLAADAQLFYRFQQTGTVASAGEGYLVVTLCNDKDR